MGCSGRRIGWPAQSYAGRRLAASSMLMLGAVGAVRAQSLTGAIQGVVTDSAEAPLQEARVLILGTQRVVLTDVTGAFAFDTVQPGGYRVRVGRLGFTPQIDSVVVLPGTTIRMRFSLRQQDPKYEVVVAPWIPPDDTQPTFALLIDPVARVARLPRMRPIPDRWKQRELRLWVGFAHTYPMQLLRMTISERGL